MIALHMFFKPKADKDEELESAIRDKWIAAMAQQPGFIRAIMLLPYSDEQLEEIGLARPEHTFEVISFWESEEQRSAWATRPIHNEVMSYVNAAAESKASSLRVVSHTWNF